jgi:hypothetical protein
MNQIEQIIKTAAEYVAATQPELDRASALRAKVAKEAVKTAAVLADRGILGKDKQDEFSEKVAADPAYALEFLRKMAGVVGVEPMGHASEKTAYSTAEQVDPFVRAYMPEAAARSNGMVD